MKRFKISLIATAIAFPCFVVVSLVAITIAYNMGGTQQAMKERASALGMALGVLFPMSVAPFWLYEAYKIGKERRAKAKKSPR